MLDDSYRPAFLGELWAVALRSAYRASVHEPIIIDGMPLTVEWFARIVNLRWDVLIAEELP